MGKETVSSTVVQFKEEIEKCRKVFVDKMSDYGTSWRVMRTSSFTDQILIKASRIRYIQEHGDAIINEGEEPEFVGIVNYCIMALIQLRLGPGEDLSSEQAERLYDEEAARATELMAGKNHDYDEAWRLMRVSSITDIILQKLRRTKQIEDNGGKTKVSEGLEANYLDMINYSLFALIKLDEAK